jgi:uncharacterized membrane protein
MLAHLVADYHLHPIVDHFTIALLALGVGAEILAVPIGLLSRSGSTWLATANEKLRSASLILMVAGSVAAVMSWFTGDMEADRLWDSMTPAAHQILAADDGAARYLSHAVLGQYVMYAFLFLAAWRVLLELSPRLFRWRNAYVFAAALAVCALMYQGKTGGELVYDHGTGVVSRAEEKKSASSSPATETGQAAEVAK